MRISYYPEPIRFTSTYLLSRARTAAKYPMGLF